MKKKWIAYIAATPLLVFGAAYWGYLRGIEGQAVIETAYIPIIQGHADCYQKRDWDCVRLTNTVMSTMFASQMEVLVENSMIDESVRAEVETFIDWHEKRTTN